MKLLGIIDHKIRNMRLVSKTGIQRIEEISRRIAEKKMKLEKKQRFAANI